MPTQPTIWENIADTPWWFFLVIVGSVAIAWLATQPKTVPIKNLMIMSAVYIPLSVTGIFLSFSVNLIIMGIWISSVLVGILLGWLHFRILRIKAIKNEASLYLPGTWIVFIVLLLITIAKYYYGFSMSLDLQTLMQAKYTNLIVSINGLFAGLFIGKIIYSLRCIKHGPYHANA